MDILANNIINKLANKNIFKTRSQPQNINELKKEISTFLTVLINNRNNHVIFHGYINNQYLSWGNILTDDFITCIREYNIGYERDRARIEETKRIMVEMATSLDTEMLLEELNDMSIFPTVKSLNDSTRKLKITKRKKR